MHLRRLVTASSRRALQNARFYMTHSSNLGARKTLASSPLPTPLSLSFSALHKPSFTHSSLFSSSFSRLFSSPSAPLSESASPPASSPNAPSSASNSTSNSNPSPPLTSPPRSSFMRKFSDYNQLGALRLSFLNALGSSVGYLLFSANLGAFSGTNLALVSSGSMLLAMSAKMANQIYEVNLDRKYGGKKANRPLPAGRVQKSEVSVMCALTGLGGMSCLYSASLECAVVGAATWFLYACVYTPLKTRTVFNTHLGAIVGALPPLIGELAAGASLSDPRVYLLPIYLFGWQFPHFYGLAAMEAANYKKAGFRMIPGEDPTGSRTMTHINLGLLLQCAATVGLFATDMVSHSFLLYSGVLFGIQGVLHAWFRKSPSTRGYRLFGCTILFFMLYVFAVGICTKVKAGYDVCSEDGYLAKFFCHTLNARNKVYNTLCIHHLDKRLANYLPRFGETAVVTAPKPTSSPTSSAPPTPSPASVSPASIGSVPTPTSTLVPKPVVATPAASTSTWPKH